LQTDIKTGMVHQSNNNDIKEELQISTRQQITGYYFLKYRHDHSFVIGDNKLKHDVEVMRGIQRLYCTFHDTRNEEHRCEHIRFIKMLDELQN
jgi:hypothetical protein